MRLARHLAVAMIACVAGVAVASQARAVSPRNPYRTFNLSGINYGSMQWERAQQQGKRAGPSTNTPSGSYRRGSSVAVGGAGGTGGAVVQRSSTQPRRGLFRRR